MTLWFGWVGLTPFACFSFLLFSGLIGTRMRESNQEPLQNWLVKESPAGTHMAGMRKICQLHFRGH